MRCNGINETAPFSGKSRGGRGGEADRGVVAVVEWVPSPSRRLERGDAAGWEGWGERRRRWWRRNVIARHRRATAPVVGVSNHPPSPPLRPSLLLMLMNPRAQNHRGDLKLGGRSAIVEPNLRSDRDRGPSSKWSSEEKIQMGIAIAVDEKNFF
jgi:hypothetical protein